MLTLTHAHRFGILKDMKIISILLKIILCLVLASSVLLFVIQEDPWCKNMLEAYLAKLFRDSFKSHMRCRVSSCDLVRCMVTLKDIEVSPVDTTQDWSWRCKKYTMQASWWKLLVHGIAEITSTASDFNVFTAVTGTDFAIAAHIKTLLESPFILPITIKSCSIRRGNVQIRDVHSGFNSTLSYNSHSLILGNKCKTVVSLTHTDLTGSQATNYIDNVGGNIECDIIARPTYFDVQASAQLTGTITSLPADHRTWILSASFKDGRGYFDMHNDNHTIAGSIASIGESLMLQSSAMLPIAYLENLLYPGISAKTSGLIMMQIDADLHNLDHGTRARITLDQPRYQTYGLYRICIDGHTNTGVAYADIALQLSKDYTVTGNASYDLHHHAARLKCIGQLPSLLSVTSPHLDLDLQLNGDNVLGSWSIESHNNESCMLLHSDIQGTLDEIIVQGTINDTTFSINGALWPSPILRSAHSQDADGADMLTLTLQDGMMNAVVDISLIKGLLHHVGDIELHGEGTVSCQGTQTEQGITGTISFSGGALRLSLIHNGIIGMQAAGSLSWAQQNLFLHDIQVNLHKGTVLCNEMNIMWNEQGLTKFQAPFELHECFVSHHKDFFAILSGTGVVEKTDTSTRLSSTLSIDRSHLKSNVLAGQVHNDVFMPSFLRSGTIEKFEGTSVDIAVTTKEPMKVRTPFLQTNAVINATVKGEMSSLTGQGTIELVGGSLSFPYKPLYITNGKIMLTAHQLDNPIIELKAKNTLKKYTVSAAASGTARKPKISFSSSPPLSEEQIITLLCTGSEHAELLSAVPSVIMYNVQQLIFGPPEEASTFSKYVKKILQPLGTVRVTPTILDGKDHTGLQASVEVDINERIRGSICKNLSASQDTKVELEYVLSDEMRLRGTKDERGDLGAELEFRLNW